MKALLISLLLVLSTSIYAGGKSVEDPELTKEQAAYIQGYADGTWTLNSMFGPDGTFICGHTWDGTWWHDAIVTEARWLLSLELQRDRHDYNKALLARRALLLAWGCGYTYP